MSAGSVAGKLLLTIAVAIIFVFAATLRISMVFPQPFTATVWVFRVQIFVQVIIAPRTGSGNGTIAERMQRLFVKMRVVGGAATVVSGKGTIRRVA